MCTRVAHPGGRDLLDPVHQRRLIAATRPIAVHRARNHHHRARLGLTCSVSRLQVVHQFASACRLQIFRRTTSCSMILSRLKSATNFLSLVFSSSSRRSRRSSDGPNPAKRFFQLKNVACAMCPSCDRSPLPPSPVPAASGQTRSVPQ